jgi:hypothetical protein
MKVAHPRLIVQSTVAVVPAVHQPTGLPPSRAPVRPEDIAPALEASRQA